MGLRIAIDTGGTFTDVVAIDEADGRRYALKTPSTPADPSIGLLDGIRKAAEAAGRDEGAVTRLLHGSTTATNAVLEHRFEGLGLIVTEGFRHIIVERRGRLTPYWGDRRLKLTLHLVCDHEHASSLDGRGEGEMLVVETIARIRRDHLVGAFRSRRSPGI